MKGLEVRKILQANHVNLAWLAEEWGITPQALSSRLNAKIFKNGYLIEITQILGKDIFGIKNKTDKQPILNVSVSATHQLNAENYPIIEYVTIPCFAGCVGVYYFSEDAKPNYKAGDIIFLQEVKNITLGQNYFIQTKSEKFIRAIFQNTDNESYKLVPLNVSYSEHEIKKKDILHVYRIFGKISREQT